jgi:hypothetical protein
VKLITESSRKDDRLDAQTLARLARIDPQLLRPIRHRSEKAQTALMTIRVRAALISARTNLVNTARGLAKALGERLLKCDADQMGVPQSQHRAPSVQGVLVPLLEVVKSSQIRKGLTLFYECCSAKIGLSMPSHPSVDRSRAPLPGTVRHGRPRSAGTSGAR